MSKEISKVIKVKQLSNFEKWLEVVNINNVTYLSSKKYNELYKKGEALLKEPIDWSNIAEVVEACFIDEVVGSEVYLRLVETYFKQPITTGAELWRLTIDKNQDIKDKKGIEYSQFLVTSANKLRYKTYLYYLLTTGAKYKDILLIEPKDFNLPEQWSGILATNKEEVILWAIGFTYLINETGGLMMLPSLRAVANEIEAPYSVLMKCYKIFNGGSKREDLKDLKAQIDNKIKERLPLLMDEIGDKYYNYFSKEDFFGAGEYKNLKGKALKDFKEDVLEELKTEFCLTLTLMVLNEFKENDKKELDELRTIISQDIVKYFLQELIDFKNSVSK